MPEPTDLLTASEVAQRLRVSPMYVVKLCRANKIPATKPLGTWLIPAAWVEQAVAAGFNQQQEAS